MRDKYSAEINLGKFFIPEIREIISLRNITPTRYTNHNHTRSFHGHIEPTLCRVYNLNSIVRDRYTLKMIISHL